MKPRIAILLAAGLSWPSTLTTPVQAQNLVPNGSFETLSSCPTNVGQVYLAPPWSPPTPASSDYFHACATVSSGANVPSTMAGNQIAQDGQAFMGVITYDWNGLYQTANNYREYIQVPLTAPLTPGGLYQVSLWVSLAPDSEWATDGLGAYFSVGPVTSNSMGVLPYLPQVSNPINNILDQAGVWTEISGVFTALGGEDTLTIGNFLGNNAVSALVTGANWQPHGYYFVDNVSVVPFPCTPPPADLVGWWALDEPSGPTASDLTGGNAGIHVTGNQAPTPLPGKVAHGLEFHGAGGGFVLVPDAPELNFGPAEDFSIDFWLRLNAPPQTTGQQALVNKIWHSTPSSPGYSLILSADQLVLTLAADTGQVIVTPGAALANDTDWHFVAVTVARNDTQGARFYLDGTLLGAAQDPTPAVGSLITDPPLELGGDSSPFPLPTLDGMLDEVELFRRVLTPGEIQDLFLADAAGKCKTDCNDNGVLDSADIESGTSADLNANGKPDECESFIVSLAGSVGTACGTPAATVLRINGQSGGPGRSVSLRVGDPIRITISEPPGDVADGTASLCCVYLWAGLPGEADAVELPLEMGFMAFGPAFLATRQPLVIWNAIGFPNLLGAHNAPGNPPVIPDAAELELIALPAGLGQPITLTLQGLVQDSCSPGGVGFSVTNGVMLRTW